METHLIFYVDFLGVKQLVRNTPTHPEDVERINSFTQLLHYVASLRGDLRVMERPLESGRQFIVQPEISTFSDHIVISYDIETLKSMGGNEFASGFLITEKLILSIAAKALKLGMLIRGGVTLGPLHHKDGVVLGPAMVEAYELESSLAIYPRIVISNHLYSELRANFDLMLLRDFDGIIHLNYFRAFLVIGNHEKQLIASWDALARDRIEENIKSLEQNGLWKEASKWVWLKNSIEQELGAIEKRAA